jgi:purine-nucleoside phosphorylase
MIHNSIPTPHIEATSPDEIANTVLMPGDPLRAKFIADTYLTDVKQFNQVRGMLGFTGYYKGKRVSVMGSGMGAPSAMIYFHELYSYYGVETIIRIGTSGAMQPFIKLRDVVVATAACTNSNINTGRFGPNVTFAPTPDFDLLLATHAQAEKMGITTHFGTVMSGDIFYDEKEEKYGKRLQQYGVLAGEMESAGLYSVARKLNKKSLAMFTISDSALTGEEESAQDRQQGYTQMMELALEIAPE